MKASRFLCVFLLCFSLCSTAIAQWELELTPIKTYEPLDGVMGRAFEIQSLSEKRNPVSEGVIGLNDWQDLLAYAAYLKGDHGRE